MAEFIYKCSYFNLFLLNCIIINIIIKCFITNKLVSLNIYLVMDLDYIYYYYGGWWWYSSQCVDGGHHEISLERPADRP